MESDRNKLAYGDPFFIQCVHLLDRINHVFMSIHKIKKCVTVSMNTVATKHRIVKVWTHRSELPQGNLPQYLTQPEITRKRQFKLIPFFYSMCTSSRQN